MSTPDASGSQLEAMLRRIEAPPTAAARDIFFSEPNPGRDGHYLLIGGILGTLIGFVTFVGAYVYCIASGGFFIGFGLGWIPSGIVALSVSQCVRFFGGQ